MVASPSSTAVWPWSWYFLGQPQGEESTPSVHTYITAAWAGKVKRRSTHLHNITYTPVADATVHVCLPRRLPALLATTYCSICPWLHLRNGRLYRVLGRLQFGKCISACSIDWVFRISRKKLSPNTPVYCKCTTTRHKCQADVLCQVVDYVKGI